MAKIGSKAERGEIEQALRLKADTSEVELWLQSKASLEEVGAQLQMLSAETARAVETKASARDISAAAEQLDRRVQAEAAQIRVEISQAVAPMAPSSQVETALSQLVSKSAVDSALLSMEKKANIDDIIYPGVLTLEGGAGANAAKLHCSPHGSRKASNALLTHVQARAGPGGGGALMHGMR